MTVSRIEWLIEKQEGLADINRESLEALQLTKLNALLMREHQRQGHLQQGRSCRRMQPDPGP